MYNLLIDKLPNTVEVGGMKYEINSDFRCSLLFEMMINDRNLEDEEKLFRTLELYYYPQKIEQPYINEAIDKALWFYRCGKDIKQSKGKGKNQKKQIYSFEDDSEYIYSAFMHDYSVDLNEIEYLHWWKFKALFKSLHDDNELCKIMSYRAKDLSKIKDKDEKAFYRQMQELYKIEEQLTDEEIQDIEKWKEILK